MKIVARHPSPVTRHTSHAARLFSRLLRITEHVSRVTHEIQKGFTLLELVLVIILAMAIAVVLGLIASQGIRGGLAQAERRDMVKEGMEALEKMTRDMRMISDAPLATTPITDPAACPANSPTTDIACARDVATPQQIEFRSNASSAIVCYRVNGSTLERGTGAAPGADACGNCSNWEAVARNVISTDMFDYYQYNGSKLANGGDLALAARCTIWRIEIELQLRRGTSTTDPMRNVTLRTSVFPRDLAER